MSFVTYPIRYQWTYFGHSNLKYNNIMREGMPMLYVRLHLGGSMSAAEHFAAAVIRNMYRFYVFKKAVKRVLIARLNKVRIKSAVARLNPVIDELVASKIVSYLI